MITIIGTEILSVQNAALIREELHPAQKMSYELELALNIKGLAETLSPEERLSQVVDSFLKMPAPTWEQIVKALKSPHVDCKTLAKNIEDIFCSDPPKGPYEGMIRSHCFGDSLIFSSSDELKSQRVHGMMPKE